MEKKGRMVVSVVIVILIAYFLLGLVGVLPENMDVVKRATAVDTPSIIEYPVPTAHSNPAKIVYNSHDNCIYFTEFNSGKIGRMTEAGTIIEYPTPTPDSQPIGITFDSHNLMMYFTEYANNIGVMTETGGIGEYALPTIDSTPYDITYNSHDQHLYFTEFANNKIGKMTEAGVITEYTPPTSHRADLQGITFNSHNNCVYFTEYGNNKIGNMTEGGSFTEVTVPTGSSAPYGITFNSHDNCIYFTESITNKIGKMSEGGSFTEYTIPTTNSRPLGITYNSFDNCMYFVETNGNKIGNMTEAGTFTEYAIPTINSEPLGITYNSHENRVYFAEQAGNKIGVLGNFPAVTPPSGSSSNITVTITKAGEWTVGNTTIFWEKLGTPITIQARIECTDSINHAQLIYRGIGDTNTSTSSMTLISGNSKNGVWQGVIPAEQTAGVITFSIQATSVAGDNTQTQYQDLTISAQAPLVTAESATDWRLVTYISSISILSIVGIAINRPQNGWRKGK